MVPLVNKYRDLQFPNLVYQDPVIRGKNPKKPEYFLGTYLDAKGNAWTLPLYADPESGWKPERAAYDIKGAMAQEGQGPDADAVYQAALEDLQGDTAQLETDLEILDAIEGALGPVAATIGAPVAAAVETAKATAKRWSWWKIGGGVGVGLLVLFGVARAIR